MGPGAGKQVQEKCRSAGMRGGFLYKNTGEGSRQAIYINGRQTFPLLGTMPHCYFKPRPLSIAIRARLSDLGKITCSCCAPVLQKAGSRRLEKAERARIVGSNRGFAVSSDLLSNAA